MSLADFQREAEKLYDLFLLAMDEVSIQKILCVPFITNHSTPFPPLDS
jgi:hypothetical protein